MTEAQKLVERSISHNEITRGTYSVELVAELRALGMEDAVKNGNAWDIWGTADDEDVGIAHGGEWRVELEIEEEEDEDDEDEDEEDGIDF